ncbi:MAG: repressor LexA [Planctomycetota bacterium]|jgi:repressor LexA
MTQVPLTRRQYEIMEFLRTYVVERGISPTLEEIADNFGVNKVTIFGHVRELERKGVILKGAPGVSRSIQIVEDESTQSSPTIQILGNIAAGCPIEAIENPEPLDMGDLIPDGRDVYALRVQGQSMIEDAIADGDIVLIERRDTAHNGETVVAILPEGGATLKRYYKEADHFRLQPANSTMEPILTKELEIRGVVVGVVRQY